MCHRDICVFECSHEEEVTTKCRSPQSTIIPKRCLPKFTLPVKKHVQGQCTPCSIKKMNAAREAKEQKERSQFEGRAETTRGRRVSRENIDATNSEQEMIPSIPTESKDWIQELLDLMDQTPLAEMD